ncbi:MAG: hypothetical protein OXH16_01990, partial [Gemmatimonadetes bacterium]|nr:hypothetical protein [Gemmatimonadota bacterium]
MLEIIYNWLLSLDVEPEIAKNWIAPLLVGLCILALSVIADFIVKRIALRTLKYVLAKTQIPWNDACVEHRVLDRLAHLAPAVVIYLLADLPFAGMTAEDRDYYVAIIRDAIWVMTVIIGVWVVEAFLNAALSVYQTFEISREVPGKGFAQVLQVLTYFFASIFILTIFLNRSPLYFL